ncbi:DUF7919 family protein [Tessaracoccus defluvii]|uniref:DUF7919 domain-containing protein n=1 Tax=Tessaracoccus defluvii TaxID=1285901 RepID=A0A7H0H610_9ACTN|nr:hypothetical protein [Tessaracoccus defluvii]QNP55976.1 hypothetical protein H9L22_00030 [Tessaracoccus defluvii]
MYFEDLTSLPDGDGRVAVGWLEAGHAFTTGGCDPRVRDRLVHLAFEPEERMRGYHYCEFCTEESPISVTGAEDPGKFVNLGDAEIWVRDREQVFAAPTLIIHYIDAHGYRPPAVFCEAVLAQYPS